MDSYNYLSEDFIVSDKSSFIEVMFRNPSSNFIIAQPNPKNSDLKIMSDRKLAILKPKKFYNLPKKLILL